MPKSIPHHDPHGGAHRHTVVMQPGTRLEHIYGPGEIRVNSYHHQGIRKLAPIFRVAALAPDGLIEGFEGKDHSWWVTGVQWHPENEGNISLDMQLIEAFVEAAAASKMCAGSRQGRLTRSECLVLKMSLVTAFSLHGSGWGRRFFSNTHVVEDEKHGAQQEPQQPKEGLACISLH